MGCDIHIVAQRRVNGAWQCVDGAFAEGPSPFDWRQYGMFGWLAGVRNYSGVEPISLPRGVPDDVGQLEGWPRIEDEGLYLGDHSYSWFSVEELLAVDYDQVVEDRRVSRQVAHNLFSGAETCEPGEGEYMKLRTFLGPQFMADLDMLRALGAERIVFGFDN